MSLATIVKGNTFSLAIPLQVYAVEDGEVVLRDYTPESGDNITIRLKGDRRNYTYIPSTNGSTAFIHLEGSEVVGVYAVEVEIVKDDDCKLTSMRFEKLSIVESIDELNEGQITEGIEQGAIYLDPEIFIAGKDGRGIVSITLTGTSGLVDTYTITYTDNTTSTFTVTNGEDGRSEQSDWAQTDPSADDYIKNKPSLATVATSGNYNDLSNKPTIPDAQIQADWNQTTSTAKDYIKNKPTIPAAQVNADWNASSGVAQILNKPTIPTVPTNVSAFNNDAGYLTQHQDIKTVNNTSLVGNGNIDLVPTETFNNFCPIIEDTRSSNVATITGVAPFSTLVDGQRIVLQAKNNIPNNATLTLTLSNGNVTSDIPLVESRKNTIDRLWSNEVRAGSYIEFIYSESGDNWTMLGQADSNTTYASLSQANVNTAVTSTGIVSGKLIHDNSYIVEETYSSGSLKANKFYDFGTVSSALTIPSLDATNDLVSNALNFYALRFIAGADNLSITFPTGVIVDDEPTINTGDYVEIMINLYVENNTNHFYASIKVWQAQ